MLCFDISNRQSFLDLKRWYDEIKRHAKYNTLYFLIGSKINSFVETNNMQFFKVSSKNKIGIDKTFQIIVNELVTHKLINIYMFTEIDLNKSKPIKLKHSLNIK